jgi:hypothetical protein
MPGEGDEPFIDTDLMSDSPADIMQQLSLWMALPARRPDRPAVLTKDARPFPATTNLNCLVESDPTSSPQGLSTRFRLPRTHVRQTDGCNERPSLERG